MFLSKSCIIYHLFLFHRFEWNILVKYLRGWTDADGLDGRSGVGGQKQILLHNIQRERGTENINLQHYLGNNENFKTSLSDKTESFLKY